MSEKKVNCLGLDKFQMAIIKRNYSTVKPLITKRAKAWTKLDEAMKNAQKKYDEEVGLVDVQINTFDNITKEYTKKACGYELTSEQAVLFNDNPDLFDKYKEEHPIQTEMNFNAEAPAQEAAPRDLDAEEDKEWEDKIKSGELKEVEVA